MTRMTERFYRIAGITIGVTVPEQQMYGDDGVLASYAVEGRQADYSLHMELTDCLTEPEGVCIYRDDGLWVYQCGEREIRYEGALANGLDGACLRIVREGSRGMAEVKRVSPLHRLSPKTVLNCMEAEHLIVQNCGFLLHASYIGRNGRAILFTAPSGTGKSTQAALWATLRGARQINGDRTAIQIAADGSAWAAGIPFSGSSGICENITLPLEAVVYLTQAPGNCIRRLFGAEAFRRIWEGCCVNIWNRKDVSACTQMIGKMLAEIPVLYFACTPDESAVLALEQALEGIK